METYDIAIVGAGPAGLSAALYAARFCRSTLVLHDGTARAAYIPLSRNVPGFDAGIAGTDLLDRMTRHAVKFGAKVVEAKVADIARTKGGFTMTCDNGEAWCARAIILATGMELNRSPLDDELQEAAIDWGVLRYCPVCDGYEHKGTRIAVLGCDISGAGEALFLAGFSSDVTLIPRHDVDLTTKEMRDLERAGIEILPEPVSRFEPTEHAMVLHFGGDIEPLAFDVLYAALGSRPRNRLARQLGLAIDEQGNVAAAAPFGTAIPGLFCAGDIVEGLDQISVAMGQGAVAATKAHNWLRECEGETVDTVLAHHDGGGSDD